MISYILYRIAQAISKSFPLKKAYAIAVFLADLRFHTAFMDRRNVFGNLKVIFPDKTVKEINEISVQIFRNFAKYLVDFFRLDELDLDYINKNVKLTNLHYIKDSLLEGKGVILVSAHLGNWELGGVVISTLGYPLVTVALKHKSGKVNEFFFKQREQKGVRVLPLGNAAKGCLKVLKNNELLALVGDRNFMGKGIVLDFFGKPTVLPLGPAFLSLQTQARIIPGFLLRKPDDTFELVFVKPLEYNLCGDKEKDLKEIANKYKTVIEDYIRRFPEQWFMFRKFWVD